jgi:hypothetical protein
MFEAEPIPDTIQALDWMRTNGYEWTKIRDGKNKKYGLFRVVSDTEIVYIHCAKKFADLMRFVQESLMPSRT